MTKITFILVIAAAEQPLAPCHPKRARQLLKAGRAKPCRRWDIFAIQLKSKVVPAAEVTKSSIGIDPGSEHTGLAVFKQKPDSQRTALLTITLHHRGQQVKKRMKQRADYRRARRFRLRNRPCRIKNRKHPAGWLQPSYQSRLANTLTWISRLERLIAIDQILVETIKCDTQKLQNPHIQGKEYQQGPLYQTTLKTYVFNRDGNKCRYCGNKPTRGNPLTKDHVVPVATMGPTRPDNIVAACYQCNMAKGSQPVEQFLKTRKKRLATVLSQLQKPMASVGQSNAIFAQLLKTLQAQGRNVTQTAAAETAANRQLAGIEKTHSNDAAVVGTLTSLTNLPPAIEFLAQGHGRRQRCMPDKNGTPRGEAWRQYCRDRNQGQPPPALPPGHKQRQIRFPNTNGISTGDYVTIQNKNGQFTGYAMLQDSGTRISLAFHKPKITGYISTTQLLRRSHGYLRIS